MKINFSNLNFKVLSKSELSFVNGGTEVPVPYPYPCPGSGSTGSTSGGTVGTTGSTTSTSNGDEAGALRNCLKTK